MTGPLFTDFDLADLRQHSTAGLVHTARQRIQANATLPNREKAKTASWGPPICCLYKAINSTQAELAAAQGIEATGTLKVPMGQQIRTGSIWEVTADCEEPFVVEVSGDLVRVGKIMRLVAVKDTQLNKP